MPIEFEVVYENGVLRPLTPCNLKEGQIYSLFVQEIVDQDLPDRLESDAPSPSEFEGQEQTSP